MLNFDPGETKSSIEKFKRMLKTNLNFYFDAQEFEDIIVHFLGFGDNQLAKKALQMGLEQHPSCHGLLLLQSELHIIDENYDIAADIKYFLRLSLKKEAKICCLNKITVFIGTGGFSSIYTRRKIQQVLKAYYLRFGLFSLIPFFLRYFRKLMTIF